ncbi:MAG: glucose-1-phosphate thymidylyltransferase [Candidatus Omnitrophica bacterium]|nr:glucose-1-phosphate thymidylyltransferase [Candidatus Omnitrophota bacterium]
MLRPEDFFNLRETKFFGLFDGVEYVWEALNNIKGFIGNIISPNISLALKEGRSVKNTVVLHKGRIIDSGFSIEGGDVSKGELVVKVEDEVLTGASVIYAGAVLMDEAIEVGEGSVIEPGALIKGPTIVGNNTEIRQGAYIRGNVLIGEGCVVGHTTEIKSSVMLGGSKAGHFAYIGDSILGRANLGAGTKLANLKIVDTPVTLKIDEKKYDTGLRKFGAILGDGVETGCNSVTMPGTLLSKGVLIYPNTTVSGYCASNVMVKLKQDQEKLTKRV